MNNRVKNVALEGTGEPISIDYLHNTENANLFKGDNSFNQKKEPIGQYFIENDMALEPERNWTAGVKHFSGPLVVDFGGSYTSGDNWKDRLSKAYDGKSGRELTQALVKDGFDALITRDKNNNMLEMVDLTVGKAGKPLLIDDNWLLSEKSSDDAKARAGAETGTTLENGVSHFKGEFGADRYLLKKDDQSVAGMQVVGGNIADFHIDEKAHMPNAGNYLVKRAIKDHPELSISEFASPEAEILKVLVEKKTGNEGSFSM